MGSQETTQLRTRPPQDEERQDLPLSKPVVDPDAEAFSSLLPWAKVMIVALASVSGFMSPFSSTIYVPALDEISKKLHISRADTLLSVTLYLVFQGLSPSFWGPLSDQLGRRPILLSTFTVLLGANLGLAFSNTFLASTGAAHGTGIWLQQCYGYWCRSHRRHSSEKGAGTVHELFSVRCIAWSVRRSRGGRFGIASLGLARPLFFPGSIWRSVKCGAGLVSARDTPKVDGRWVSAASWYMETVVADAMDAQARRERASTAAHASSVYFEHPSNGIREALAGLWPTGYFVAGGVLCYSVCPVFCHVFLFLAHSCFEL